MSGSGLAAAKKVSNEDERPELEKAQNLAFCQMNVNEHSVKIPSLNKAQIKEAINRCEHVDDRIQTLNVCMHHLHLSSHFSPMSPSELWLSLAQIEGDDIMTAYDDFENKSDSQFLEIVRSSFLFYHALLKSDQLRGPLEFSK